MRWLHLAVGIVGVAGFLGTGQYMDLVHDHLRGMDDTHRLLFRSTHIYLLFASLVNLALGLHLKPVRGWAAGGCGRSAHCWCWVRRSSRPSRSSPKLWLTDLGRPYTRFTTYLCFAGMLLHLICWKPKRDP